MDNNSQGLHYRRSYKACVACRQRKSRCEVGDNWTPGAPCKRCHRQMKECIFPAERIGAKDTTAGTATSSRLRRHRAGALSDDAVVTREREPQPQPPTATAGSIIDETSPQLSVGASSHRRPSTNDAHDGNVSDSVMRTMISSGNDALEALFDPVMQGSQARPGEMPPPSTSAPQGRLGAPRRLRGPSSSSSVYEMWNACRFVKQGWFSAEEAVFFIDMFFAHHQKLSPILTDWYSRHENHYQLISSEPLLCCTILALSAGYHVLPCAGGSLRGFFIHERLWTHIQHLILRILLGQEKNSKGKTRTLGTIEALLLLTEWHPRSLAFPPPIDGWDSDLLVHWTEDCNDVPLEKVNDARGRWLEDVINPAKRTGHMSWMLISCAVSLAVELGVFEDPSAGPRRPLSRDDSRPGRQGHLQKLLYLYAEQVSLQHGRPSVLPQGVSHQILRGLQPPETGSGDLQWFMVAWINLTKLTRVVMETLYSSGSQTSSLLQSGRYVNLVEHFNPVLSSWKDTYLVTGGEGDAGYFQSFLRLEYYSARLYCHSLCIQAVIERCASQNGDGFSARFANNAAYDVGDYQFVEEVRDCASHALSIANQLADQGVLRYVPARVVIRIIAASIFLLKALGIGVSAARLQASLELLQRTISALRCSAVDEMHLGLRYAMLLEMHLAKLQESFITSTYPLGLENQSGLCTTADDEGMLPDATQGFTANPEDWFSLPFDAAAFASTETNEVLGFSSFDGGDLDFIWNLNFDLQGQLNESAQPKC